MVDVFFTVDVEIWCGGWKDIDGRFPRAYEQYIQGKTSSGNFGLPYQADVLRAHGLVGAFFVEPLFARRFGVQPLSDIVGLLQERGQEVQLHLHPEWVDEAREPIFPLARAKQAHLSAFSAQEQTTLIACGLELMKQAGADGINTFRAGSFAFNQDTLPALVANGIAFDSSYNASMHGLDSGVMPGTTLVEPVALGGVHEYPMTVYGDGTSRLRHAQLTACSFAELEGLLWQAAERGRQSFVILSHGFELLNRAKDRPDPVVVRRFQRLCRFLDRHRNVFCVRGFQGLQPLDVPEQPSPLTSPLLRTGLRMASQLYRRRFA